MPSDVIISPNPGSEDWHLEINLKESQDLNVNVIDALGRTVYKKELKGSAGSNYSTIPISDIPRGVYWIHIFNEQGNIVTKLLKKLN